MKRVAGEDAEATRTWRVSRKTENDTKYQASNPAHVEAFVLLSQTRKRVRKEALIEAIAHQEEFVENFQDNSVAYLTAPRGNFPGGVIPDPLLPYYRSMDFIRASFEIANDGANWSDIYFFDSSVKFSDNAEQLLGQGLGKMKFQVRRGRTARYNMGEPSEGEICAASSAPAKTLPGAALAFPAVALATQELEAAAPATPLARPALVPAATPEAPEPGGGAARARPGPVDLFLL